MQNLKLSIIVPVYNAEKYLDRCIKSIYDQTFTDYEIILVNDGSSDNSLALCRKYAENDNRITVIDKKNGGAGSARNAGLIVATGEYVTFPDVDDWFEPNMYEELYALAKSGDYDIVFSGFNNYSQNLKHINTVNCSAVDFKTQKECRKNIMTLFPTTTIFDAPWNKLYKRQLIEENRVRFTDLRRCQDAVFNLDVYRCAKSVRSTEKAYYNYLNNDSDKVNKKFPKDYIDINIYYYYHIKEMFESWGMYKGDIKTHYDSSFLLGVYGSVNMFDNPLWKLTRKEQKEFVENILNKKEVTEFFAYADVRQDCMTEYNLIKNKDIKGIFKARRKEKFREKLRNNKFLITIYRCLRRVK
ncbi:MAG: glycosyltransferase [Clostridia bacterium]|nr:glycosyltransferase [Clostridia bacterium]